jgi:hypothetical protein
VQSSTNILIFCYAFHSLLPFPLPTSRLSSSPHLPCLFTPISLVLIPEDPLYTVTAESTQAVCTILIGDPSESVHPAKYLISLLSQKFVMYIYAYLQTWHTNHAIHHHPLPPIFFLQALLCVREIQLIMSL